MTLNNLPIVEVNHGIANRFSDKVMTYKVNAEQAMDLTEELSVFKVPSIIVFKNGVEAHRETIKMNKDELYVLFQNALK